MKNRLAYQIVCRQHEDDAQVIAHIDVNVTHFSSGLNDF